MNATVLITCWDSYTNESSPYSLPLVKSPETVDDLLNLYADASGEPADELARWTVEQQFETAPRSPTGWRTVLVLRNAVSGDLCTLAYIVHTTV